MLYCLTPLLGGSCELGEGTKSDQGSAGSQCVTPEEGVASKTIQSTTCTKVLAGKTRAATRWNWKTLGILQVNVQVSHLVKARLKFGIFS